MEFNEEYDLIINKLASIRDNYFNEEDMEAEGHGMEDAVADPYAVVCYIENKLRRQKVKIEKCEKQLSELVCVIYEHANEGTELMEIAERIDETE